MTTTETISVLIVDDHDVLRKGITSFLKAYPDLTLIGEADNGAEAVEQCAALRPDVVLMDLMMPEMDGITAIKTILAQAPDTRIIAFSSFVEPELAQAAVEAGVTGYLLKNISADQLANAIRSANSGFSTLAPEVSQSLAEQTQSEPEKSTYDLTKREQDVLKLLMGGLSNAEIGQRLHISKHTVKNYVSNVLDKLEVSSRTEAVSLALQEEIVPLE